MSNQSIPKNNNISFSHLFSETGLNRIQNPQPIIQPIITKPNDSQPNIQMNKEPIDSKKYPFSTINFDITPMKGYFI